MESLHRKKVLDAKFSPQSIKKYWHYEEVLKWLGLNDCGKGFDSNPVCNVAFCCGLNLVETTTPFLI